MGSIVRPPKPPKPPAPIELPKYEPPPAPEPPPPMPLPNDEAIQKKKKKEMVALSQKSGRASTFLSDDEGKLG